MSKDALGDRCKSFEMAETSRKIMPGLPLLARLDGRAFHTFTRGMKRPYDERMSRCMIETTRFLVKDMHANIGYTQSDEISLLWYVSDSKSQLPFDGRIQKLTSVLAGLASMRFYKHVLEMIPDQSHLNPCFDCRAWSVPTKQDALDVFVWREDDAVKNSMSALCRMYYSPKQMHGKGHADQMDMLHVKGVNWNDQPAFFKRGSYLQRRVTEKQLTPEEIASISIKHRPDPSVPVLRSMIEELDLPPIRRVPDALSLLFPEPSPGVAVCARAVSK